MKQGISIGLAALLIGSAGGFLVGKAASSSDGDKADSKGPSVQLTRDSKRGDGDVRASRADSVDAALREPSVMNASNSHNQTSAQHGERRVVSPSSVQNRNGLREMDVRSHKTVRV